jgi:hypothetical protein
MKVQWQDRRLIVIAVIAIAAFAVRGNVYGQNDLGGRERNIRALEIGANSPKDSKTILAEVNEDLERLRAINDEFKRANSSSQSLNYNSIAENSAEIKKRGNRLKVNLAGLPKPGKEEKHPKQEIPSAEPQLRSLLSTMNTVMTGFLANPVFSDMGALDNQLALKARIDLDYLIELSDVVKKGSEKLRKISRQE